MERNNFVDELLSATNVKMYREVLDREPDKETSEFIDNWVKFIHYELETLPKEEPKPHGMRFEEPKLEVKEVDITKYEFVPFDNDKKYVFSIDLFFKAKLEEGMARSSVEFLADEFYKYHLTKVTVKNGRGYIKDGICNIEISRKYCMEVK